MDDRDIQIGQRIRKYRKEKGLNQSELAEKIGKSLRTVQKYEKGEIEVAISVISDIAEVLGVSSSEILGYKSGIEHIGSLSGGNQQKLIIARELNNHAKVIVASQPTRGLDIGATEFVRQQLIDQRNAGKGVMLISADLEEIMALSDRIAVLFGGKIVGILDREEATVQKIGLLMGGISEEEAR